MSVFTWLRGGWRTHGPSAVALPAAFDSYESDSQESVTAELAMRLSAVHACMHIRAETIGTLPLHIRDKNKQVVRDHPLYDVLHRSPNAMQTAAELKSQTTACVDMHGNHFSRVVRRPSDGKIIALEPFDDPRQMGLGKTKRGTWVYEYGPDKDQYTPAEILHQKGFALHGHMGLPRIDIGRQIIAAQMAANKYALTSFRQGIKVGGFFEVEKSLTEPENAQWKRILDDYSKPENSGRWLTLLRGMKPIGGEQFRIKPGDAELLASRGFGIEEICRLMNVPPQLIGHTDKASSWASSIENINLFFLAYSIMPTVVRSEQRLEKTLLTSYDRAAGLEIRYSLQGLLRADMKTRQAFYASALQNGWLSRNEVRDLEERGKIEGGDEYTVQTNMTAVGNTGEGAKDETQATSPSV
jgi:HK97 family phage portal protein